MRRALVAAAMAAIVMKSLAGAASAQAPAKPAGGNVCSATYTNTTDPARRAINNSGAVVLVFGSGNAATLFMWRGPKPHDRPPTALTGFDYQYQLTLTPTASGFETSYSSVASGTTVDVQITSDSAGNWMIGMSPRSAGATTESGRLRCGSKPFEAK
jgi:hypothetical protein